MPHAAGVMDDLKMVIPFTVCYAVFGYSLKTGISWFYVYYVVFRYSLRMGISQVIVNIFRFFALRCWTLS